MMDLSIVATIYQSEKVISEFCRRVSAVAESIVSQFEIILVNDGSTDQSLAIAVAMTQRDSRVKVVDLSRNFGHHRAMMIGTSHACGERVFLIDCDLEEEPEVLREFWAEMNR